MYAIIKTGGKQYCVEEGKIITVEKLDVAAGDEVTFEEVPVSYTHLTLPTNSRV